MLAFLEWKNLIPVLKRLFHVIECSKESYPSSFLSDTPQGLLGIPPVPSHKLPVQHLPISLYFSHFLQHLPFLPLPPFISPLLGGLCNLCFPPPPYQDSPVLPSPCHHHHSFFAKLLAISVCCIVLKWGLFSYLEKMNNGPIPLIN